MRVTRKMPRPPMPSSGFNTTSPCSAANRRNSPASRATRVGAMHCGNSSANSFSLQSRKRLRVVDHHHAAALGHFQHHGVVDELRIDRGILAHQHHVEFAQIAPLRLAQRVPVLRVVAHVQRRACAPTARRRAAPGRPVRSSAASGRVAALPATWPSWCPWPVLIAPMGSISTPIERVIVGSPRVAGIVRWSARHEPIGGYTSRGCALVSARWRRMLPSVSARWCQYASPCAADGQGGRLLLDSFGGQAVNNKAPGCRRRAGFVAVSADRFPCAYHLA